MGKNVDGPPLLMAKYSMDQLSGRTTVPSPHLMPEDFQDETNTAHHRLHDSDWVCINHSGRPIYGYGWMNIFVTVWKEAFFIPAEAGREKRGSTAQTLDEKENTHEW